MVRVECGRIKTQESDDRADGMSSRWCLGMEVSLMYSNMVQNLQSIIHYKHDALNLN